MDQILFQQACDQVIENTKDGHEIGTLGEKTIHAVIKNYLCPDTSCHEIKIGSYYADILTEDGIIEIQTRNFDKLRKKLEVFLEIKPVTIVFPIPYTKILRWIDEESGEISSPRKSPKKGCPYMIFPELYKIKNYLLHPNLKLHIILMDIEEYRLLNGWSKDKKKGSTRNDGIPTKLVEEVKIENIDQYEKLIPSELPETFTTTDFKKVTKLSQKYAFSALNILAYVGAIKKIGKEKQSFLYTRNNK